MLLNAQFHIPFCIVNYSVRNFNTPVRELNFILRAWKKEIYSKNLQLQSLHESL